MKAEYIQVYASSVEGLPGGTFFKFSFFIRVHPSMRWNPILENLRLFPQLNAALSDAGFGGAALEYYEGQFLVVYANPDSFTILNSTLVSRPGPDWLWRMKPL